ncbi:MAG: SDR family oxidoreductase [Burkholderiales bacterium]|jgi:NAD(P)-dependent dehydrogenase (short-subunit alcohol dehydrogenase family)
MSKKIVLVTGATKGIGRAISESLHGEGYEVVGIARTLDPTFPGRLIELDLFNKEERKRVIQSLCDSNEFFGLINNAGINRLNWIEDVSEVDYRRIMEINLDVPYELSQAVIPQMKRRKAGRIVNISSRALMGRPKASVYASAKSGLIGLTRSLALETAPFGITVNAIAPGPIGTEMFFSNNPPDSEETRKLLSSIPMSRLGEPKEVAAAATFFVSEGASYTTGQTLFVCGGMSI